MTERRDTSMTRGQVALWLVVLAPVWPLLLALACKRGAGGGDALGLYAGTHPMVSAWVCSLGYAAVLFVYAELSGNASIFDVHWSWLPAAIYLPHFALHPSSTPDVTRAVMLFAGVWFWSLRLTGNWLKKGGLRFEDFRYVRFRRTMSPLAFKVFSFVVLFELQIAMVLSMSMPAWYALRAPGRPVNALDWIALAIVVGGVVLEWIADVQGMRFRAAREAHREVRPEDLEGDAPAYPRFPQEGLWRYSRHPNYFGEIAVWWGVYLFSVAATGEWLSWAIVGPLTINGLFLGGSIGITEAHELRRKPEYAAYQRRTSRLVPWFPRR
jgi:steroid 5-alpha reductase family enzyme